MLTNLNRLAVILLVLLSPDLTAQSVIWGTSLGSDLEVLYNNTTSTFEFTNGSSPLSNASVQVQLGTGIEYVAGTMSFTASGSATVTETSVSGDNLVIFTIGALAANENLSITFSREASCDARTHKIAAGSFEDVAHVYEGATEVTYINNNGLPYELIYDVIYANIVLSAPTHSPSASTSVGGTITRSVNVTNGNFGAVDEFWFQDDYDSQNVELSNFAINGTAIDPGKISDQGGIVTISFDGTNIINVNGSGGTNGDGDALFEKDEYFALTYDVLLLDCGNGSFISDVDAFYGADINTPCNPSGSNSTSVSINNGTPNITLKNIANPRIDLCGSTTHIVSVSNEAKDDEDFAKDVVIFIGFRHNNSAIATMENVTMWGEEYNGTKQFSDFTLNGNPVTLDKIPGTLSTTVDYLPSDFFTSDPDGPGIGLEDLDNDGFYDDLGPEQSVQIGFNMTITPQDISCATGYGDYIFWEHISVDSEWSNQCGDLQAPKRSELNYTNLIRDYLQSTFVEGPADIDDGDQFEVRINPHLFASVNCNGGNALTGTDVTWTVMCVLPAGVSLQAGATTDAHHASFNPNLWASNDTVFYEINRYNRDWFTFPLEMDCAEWDNTKPMPFDFITNYKCGSCWDQNIHCQTIYAVPHCPDPCVGITTTAFEAIRTTPGWTDATMTTPVVLTPGIHGTDKMLPFDTIQMIAKGAISDTLSDNLHLRITYTPDIGGDIFDFVDGEITIYDLDGAFGNVMNTFPITTAPTVTANGNTYFWDLDLTEYISDIDPSYELGQGATADSFTVVLNSIFNKNTGANLYNVNTFRANFFMMDDKLAERSCDSYGTSISYTGFGGNTSGNVVILDGCKERELFGFFSWSNTSGDIFPNEYRPIQQIDSMILTIPTGVKFVGVTSVGGISGTPAHYQKANGDVVVYLVNQNIPDWTSTYFPRLDVHVKASCELESGNHTGEIKAFRTVYNYQPDTSLHQQVTNVSTNFPGISYVRPTIVATPLNQVQNGIADSVTWDIEVCNATAGFDVGYNWLILDNALSNGITVTSVLDANGDEITTTDFGGGKMFVPVGSVDGGDCSTITIVADYTSCEPDDLVVDFGWDCEAYPTSAAELPVCGDPTFVRVIPLEASIAAAITSLANTPTDPADPSAGNFGSTTIDMCETFPVEYRIISGANAAMYDINFDLLIPNAGNGLVYVPNSATIEVEGIDALYTPRPIDAVGEAIFVAGNSGAFNVALADLDATNFGNEEGLTGAGTNPAQNEVIIRFEMQSMCNFTSGRRLRIRTFGESFCGQLASGNGEIIRSSSLPIAGVNIPYAVSFASSISPDDTFNGCAEAKTLSVDLNIVGGPTTANDTLFVTLDQGLAYDNNFNCTSVDCPVFAGTRMENGNQIVLFNYPAGVSDEMISFNFSITTDASNQCGTIGYELSSQAEIAGLFCSESGSNCPINSVETGNIDGTVNLVNAELEVLFNTLTKTVGAPNQFDYNITVQNNGAIATDDIVSIQFFEYDIENDSLVGAMLGSVDAKAIISSNGSEELAGSFATLKELMDGVVAVIDRSAPENCSCPDPNGIDSNPTVLSSFALPVELISFNGRADGCSVELNWSTASEVNNSHFVLAYSTDGSRFTHFAKIDAQGNNNSNTQYQYTHKELNDNRYYYRLSQVDYDGKTTHFPLITVSPDCIESNEVLLFPNPIGIDKTILTMKFFTEQVAVEIEIIDLMGKVVRRVYTETERGFNSLRIDTSDLPVGTYLIKEREGKFTKQFVIME